MKAGFALLKSLAEWIYPSNIYCISCNAIIDQTRPYALCDTCIRSMKWANEKTCSKCGKILQEGYLARLCTDCRTLDHAFERGFACVEYGGAERDLIHHFKYKDKGYYGRKLAEIMADRIAVEEINFDMILPVPMYKKKEKQRGYNQAAILALFLSRIMEVPYGKGILKRIADTAPMSHLGAEERRRNLEDAFEIDSRRQGALQGKNLLLIDDVYTTGSTTDACTQVLMEAGAEKVYILVFAAGANLIQ